MKKSLLFLSFFSIYLSIHAQSPLALIEVEKAFEKSCLEKGIRDGFLVYVDSAGIVLTKKGAENAKQFWNSLPVFDGVFSWSPSYAEMSISENWGYTTGVYEHRPKNLADPVEEYGQYTTVWHRPPGGEWKFLFDIGNVHPPAPLDKKAKTILIKKYSSGIDSRKSIPVEPEKAFILSFEKNISDAYQKHASTQYILSLTGHQAITSKDSAVILLNKIQPTIKYHSSGSFISSGKDMFAVYGTLDPDNTGASYLRIWRHEKGGWKIALEVIKI